MNIIYRSWHLGCSCSLTLLNVPVVARARRHYIVNVPSHGYRKIAKWRVLACT